MLQFINDFIALIPTVVMCASLICAATPTPKDDAILAKVYKLLDWCAEWITLKAVKLSRCPTVLKCL